MLILIKKTLLFIIVYNNKLIMHVPNKVKEVTNRRFLLEIMDFFKILINS